MNADPIADYDAPVLTLSEVYDLNKLKEAGLQMQRTEMVVHRASKGMFEEDGQYGAYKAQLHDQLKYLWGAYHFARWDTDDRESHGNVAVMQARNLLYRISKYKSKEGVHDKVLLVVAWYNYGKHDTYMPVDQLGNFVREIKRLTGCLPVLYTRKSFLNRADVITQINDPKNVWIASCPLWINAPANVNVSDLVPWKKWCLWDTVSSSQSTEQKPELSYFFRDRGQELNQWFNVYAWDYKFKLARLFTDLDGKSAFDDLMQLFNRKK